MTKTSVTLTCCFAVAGAVALVAQANQTTTTTKITVENGKAMRVTGCVTTRSDGDYVLTEVANKTHPMHAYTLVSSKEDFSKVVGRRVQIDGKLGDRGNGSVEMKTDTKVDGPTGDTHAETEGSAAYLGVTHMKRIAGVCR